MTRYIDADKLSLDINDTEFWEQHDKDVAMRCVQIAETADVQKVKHGKWSRTSVNVCNGTVLYSENRFVCSQCNRCVKNKSNYCPHCGAKMDGDEK